LKDCVDACQDKVADGCFYVSYGKEKTDKSKKCSLFKLCQHSKSDENTKYDSYVVNNYASVGKRATDDNKKYFAEPYMNF